MIAASRSKRTSTDDADRLHKYLARFDLSWENVSGLRTPFGLRGRAERRSENKKAGHALSIFFDEPRPLICLPPSSPRKGEKHLGHYRNSTKDNRGLRC